ncbi:FAD-containing oxidoreductase [Sphingorhabdus sp. EL138]|uniref:FAD-containing oxidoreductase n=1 Tax=Sphingorhabdus sp. EL138 TaxID=2073156 RepID=UPI000D688EF3|nr:FAD-containing oxidoreductase [Sphingorhabdus sp. EL138]
MKIKFDAIIIGGGQAGPSLAARLASDGYKTALIERKLLGGTCVNTGCIPTKTLVASARVAYDARRAGDYGVMIEDEISVDMKRVKARMDGIVNQSQQGLTTWLQATDNLTVIRGHARLKGPDAVEVEGDILQAPRIFLNVGARASTSNIEGLETVDYHSNATILGIDELPEHLVIIGGSYIGLEFAQIYRRFGSKVTVIERSERLIRREDPDISAAVRDILAREGIEFRLNANCTAVRSKHDEIVADVLCDEGSPAIHGSHLFVATGRTPNTDDLGLDEANIHHDEHGYITVDDQLSTNVPGIWAIGECNGRGSFTHTSYNDYEIVAANLLDGEKRSVTDRIPCYALYVDPPLGRAGMTEEQARASGRSMLTGTIMMDQIGRARERGETQGFMKILVDDDTQKIVGASILGVNGDEAIHSVLTNMYADAPYTTLQRAVHIHPTVSEFIPTLLGSLKPLKE